MKEKLHSLHRERSVESSSLEDRFNKNRTLSAFIEAGFIADVLYQAAFFICFCYRVTSVNPNQTLFKYKSHTRTQSNKNSREGTKWAAPIFFKSKWLLLAKQSGVFRENKKQQFSHQKRTFDLILFFFATPLQKKWTIPFLHVSDNLLDYKEKSFTFPRGSKHNNI